MTEYLAERTAASNSAAAGGVSIFLTRIGPKLNGLALEAQAYPLREQVRRQARPPGRNNPFRFESGYREECRRGRLSILLSKAGENSDIRQFEPHRLRDGVAGDSDAKKSEEDARNKL
jgi:hypothetical protein